MIFLPCVDIEILVTYYKVQGTSETFEIPNVQVSSTVNGSTDDDVTTKLRLDHEYGIGLVLIAETVENLMGFLVLNLTNNERKISDSNIVAIVTGPCDQLIGQAEFFVKNICWHSHFVSHLILVLSHCLVCIQIFIKKLANCLEYLDNLNFWRRF